MTIKKIKKNYIWKWSSYFFKHRASIYMTLDIQSIKIEVTPIKWAIITITIYMMKNNPPIMSKWNIKTLKNFQGIKSHPKSKTNSINNLSSTARILMTWLNFAIKRAKKGASTGSARIIFWIIMSNLQSPKAISLKDQPIPISIKWGFKVEIPPLVDMNASAKEHISATVLYTNIWSLSILHFSKSTINFHQPTWLTPLTLTLALKLKSWSENNIFLLKTA